MAQATYQPYNARWPKANGCAMIAVASRLRASMPLTQERLFDLKLVGKDPITHYGLGPIAGAAIAWMAISDTS